MNVNFSVFIDKILSGEKRQTIRETCQMELMFVGGIEDER